MERIYYKIFKDDEFYTLGYCYSNFEDLKDAYERNGYKVVLLSHDEF